MSYSVTSFSLKSTLLLEFKNNDKPMGVFCFCFSLSFHFLPLLWQSLTRTQITLTILFPGVWPPELCCLRIRESQDFRSSGFSHSDLTLFPQSSQYKTDLRDPLLGVRRKSRTTDDRTHHRRSEKRSSGRRSFERDETETYWIGYPHNSLGRDGQREIERISVNTYVNPGWSF